MSRENGWTCTTDDECMGSMQCCMEKQSGQDYSTGQPTHLPYNMLCDYDSNCRDKNGMSDFWAFSWMLVPFLLILIFCLISLRIRNRKMYQLKVEAGIILPHQQPSKYLLMNRSLDLNNELYGPMDNSSVKVGSISS